MTPELVLEAKQSDLSDRQVIERAGQMLATIQETRSRVACGGYNTASSKSAVRIVYSMRKEQTNKILSLLSNGTDTMSRDNIAIEEENDGVTQIVSQKRLFQNLSKHLPINSCTVTA